MLTAHNKPKMHFEGDRFHPNATEDEDLEYEYLHDSAESIMSDAHSYNTVSTNRKKQRKNWEDMKSIDKGYRQVKRMVNHMPISVEFYTTVMMPGHQIRDAITGSRYSQYKVGSLNEHLFFKVGVATGEFGNEGTVIAFYDSPEQYERHTRSVVSTEAKKRWLDKCMEIRARNAAM